MNRNDNDRDRQSSRVGYAEPKRNAPIKEDPLRPILRGQSPKKENGFSLWSLLFSDSDFKIRSHGGIDRILLVVVLLLVCFGSVMVFSASYAHAEARFDDSLYFIKRQIIWVVAGITVMVITSLIDPSFYRAIARSAYAATLFLLLLVPIAGEDMGGARRWFVIGPISIQPSELAKMTLVLMLAWFFSVYYEKATDYNNRYNSLKYGIILPLALIGTVCGLVALEKHLSGLIILGAIGIVVMFVAGSQIKYLGALSGVGVLGVAAMAIFTDYTKRRIDIWLNPEAYPLDGGWQTIHGMMAIGSGGIFGLGLGNSRLKYSYVSQPQNDFIFTIACEELGLIGALAIITLFALLVWRGFLIAVRHDDIFCKLTAIGITSKVAIQVLLNIAVVTNTIPNTGISLPFFSYGGSSLVMLLAEMGILLSISRTSKIKK